MLRKLLRREEETAEELSLRLREQRMNDGVKSFYHYRKEMEKDLAKYTFPGAKEQFWRRADIMMGLTVEQSINAALDHHNKKHINTCNFRLNSWQFNLNCKKHTSFKH